MFHAQPATLVVAVAGYQKLPNILLLPSLTMISNSHIVLKFVGNK